MDFRGWRLLPVCALMLATFGASAATPAAEEESARAQYYGFLPVEVYRANDRAASLVSGDFNHDKLTDLAYVDNSHSRIEAWLQVGKTDGAGKPARPSRLANEIDDPARMQSLKIPVAHEVSALAAGDFNHDGRTDLVYLGNPDQLVVLYQPAEGPWTEKFQTRVPNVNAASWMIAAGDLNSDGLDDLAVLGKSETLLFHQTKGGKLELTKLLNTSDQLGLAHVGDLDGDGRNDLSYVSGESSARNLCVRLQRADRTLGPEYTFELERQHSVTTRDVDGEPGEEIVSVATRTSRVRVAKLRQKASGPGEIPERFLQFGFGKSGSAGERTAAIGDLDGDGLQDILVTDGGASRLLLYRQQGLFGLDLGTPYSSMTGTDQLAVADFDGDGQREVVVWSTGEKALGVTRFQNDRLPFPEMIPAVESAERVWLDALPTAADKPPLLMVLVDKGKGEGEARFTLEALRLEKGEWKRAPLAGETVLRPDAKSQPVRVSHADVVGDERPEILVEQGGGRSLLVYSQDDKGAYFESIEQGGASPPAARVPVSIRGEKGLLTVKDGLARFVALQGDQWQVREQFNMAETNSRLVGAVQCDLDGNADNGEELAFVDTGVRKLRVYRLEGDAYAAWKEVELGDFSFRSARTSDLNGDKKPDVLLLGEDRMAVLFTGGQAPELKELGQYESSLEKVFVADVAVGDLNNDKRPDLALVDTRSQYLEIVAYRPDVGLEHALYFKVFEQKNFASEDKSGNEPRESLIVDVTGDGLPDLVLLVFDRLLVYPQDSGQDVGK